MFNKAILSSIPLAVAAAENGAKKHPVDRIFDEVKSGIPNCIDTVRKNPGEVDSYLEASKKAKEMILNDVAETKEIPKTPALVEEAAMPFIAGGAMIGAIDAALLMIFQKLPKRPGVGKEEGAQGKENLSDLLQALAEKLQKIAQKGAQSVLQEISDDARDVTTTLFDAAKLIPIGGEKVPVEAYQATLAGMVAGAYTAGLMDTGVAYLDQLTKETGLKPVESGKA